MNSCLASLYFYRNFRCFGDWQAVVIYPDRAGK